MTTDVQTLPGETTVIGFVPPQSGLIAETECSSQTILADFDKVSHLLSQREPRRPRASALSAEELKRIAQKHQPPQEWYEGEEERPF